jgi:small-conductance mechanosensitive channel
MATPPSVPGRESQEHEPILDRRRLIVLGALLALLVLCLAAGWLTRGAMLNRSSSVNRRGAQRRSAIVDESPWQTAQTLAAMAVTAEEDTYARQAERLADHEVDQAFATALREASLRAQQQKLTGDALAISQQIEQLKQLIVQDTAAVDRLSAGQPAVKSNPGNPAGDSTDDADLEIAKAQLGLDSDELADANRDLERATGDTRPEIQSELSAREASMKKYDGQVQDGGQVAAISASRYGTLAARFGSWNRQRTRLKLLDDAQEQTQNDYNHLIAIHNQMEAAANAETKAAAAGSQDRGVLLAGIKDRSARHQLLSIYDDRIQTEQQLIEVYRKWSLQVQLQHHILLHLVVQSSVWVVLILIAMLLGDGVVRHLMERTAMDLRQRQTLRAILDLAFQLVGLGCILLVVFGAPRQTPTILGLATAALTIALQDFVLAFFGWFVLMGKKGLRVGDNVEIEGVGGEVTEVKLMSTTLLETGPLNEGGYPTGRRISFMNGFAIRGKFFNFSTAGQWMTDQFEVTLPAGADTHRLSESVLNVVEQETAENVAKADQEWKRAFPREASRRLRATSSVNLRPAGGSFQLEVRYVTRASERLETRNRLYQRVIELLGQPQGTQAAEAANS